jgi:hypothetical protein
MRAAPSGIKRGCLSAWCCSTPEVSTQRKLFVPAFALSFKMIEAHRFKKHRPTCLSIASTARFPAGGGAGVRRDAQAVFV